MTTPEQIAKWREEAFDFWLKDKHMHATTTSSTAYRSGYLRAKQENEHALKQVETLFLKIDKNLKNYEQPIEFYSELRELADKAIATLSKNVI